MRAFMTACLPDLERAGLEASLAALSVDVGLDSLCVHALSDGRSITVRDESGSVEYFEYEDGACFQPDSKHYGGTRLRPHIQSWIKHRNPLDALAKAAEKNRLRLFLRLNGCHQPAVAQRHPMLTCVNILGAASHSWLCPSHPEVREYLCALAEDLATNYGPAVIEMEHVGFPSDRLTAFAPFEAGADLSCAAEMLNWCFCAACREKMGSAGIDSAELVARGRDFLSELLNYDESAEAKLGDWLMNDPMPKTVREASAQTVSTLLRAVQQRTATQIGVVGRPTNPPPEIPGAASLESLIEYNVLQTPSSVPCPVYRAYPPTCPDGPALVAAVHAAVTGGHEMIGFAEYGLLTPVSLDWVRQAIRFAKRVAS